LIPDRLAANLAWLFTDVPWPQRFTAAREAGFVAVEFPWPAHPAATAAAVRRAGLRVALINAPAGDLAAGDRGWPNDPARAGEWREACGAALDLANEVGCPTVNILAGNRLDGVPDDAQRACLDGNLQWALAAARARGVTLVTELLNRRENPRYPFASVRDAEALLERLGDSGLKLQLDTYHLGLGASAVSSEIRRAGRSIGHVQVADVPGRHEPGTGGLDWIAILDALRQVGYEGHIGLEYRPTSDFSWAAGWGSAA
jgi:hydroxypyruvate isomerase